MLEAVTGFFGAMSAGIFIAHAIDGYRSRQGARRPHLSLSRQSKPVRWRFNTPGKCFRSSDRARRRRDRVRRHPDRS